MKHLSVPHELADLDIWNLAKTEDGWTFDGNLKNADGPRGFVWKKGFSNPLAQSSGDVDVFLGLGGASAALGNQAPSDWPYHITTSGDDVGTVGVFGTHDTQETNLPGLIRDRTLDALMAENFLTMKRTNAQHLPLCFVRTETDGSQNAKQFAKGQAFKNTVIAAKNAASFAKSLGKQANIRSITIQFCEEDVSGTSGPTWQSGILSLIENLNKDLRKISGLNVPKKLPVVMWFANGVEWDKSNPAIVGQWELALGLAGQNILCVGPDYGFEKDDYARLTDHGRSEKSKMGAMALQATMSGQSWECPAAVLAEWDGLEVVVTSTALANLVIDQDQLSNTGDGCGFSLCNTKAEVVPTKVTIDANDPKTLRIQAATLTGDGPWTLNYAVGAAHPTGAICDAWFDPTAPQIKRWMLPCSLPITGTAP